MRRIIELGVNDLATTNPELLECWDYEKNGDKIPQNFTAGSNQYAFWKCKYGHSYRSRIVNMTHSRKGMNCPICRNFKTVSGINDLATTHSFLLSEWDYEKNTLSPNEVAAGSNQKAWWKCEKGHSWDSVISSRALRNLGCPYCSNQKLLKGYNDTATLMPEILEYWDYDKNEKGPDDFIGTSSAKEIWLKCNNGHSWKTTIATFGRGSRCPYCGNKKVDVGFNDLTTTNPELCKEWDYSKNLSLRPEMFTHGSDNKVWWKCEKGHSWRANISARVRGNGCPICLREYQTSITEKAFSFYLSKSFKDLKENVHLPELKKRELDIYIPSLKLGVEYDGHNWHKDFERDLIKDQLCNENGIVLIRIREQGCAEYKSTAHFIKCEQNHGDLVKLEKPINEMIVLINKLYGLNIPTINSIEKDIAAINESYYSYNKSNSLASRYPLLIKEWNNEKNKELKPDMISAGSNSKVWWKCDKGHEWLAVVSSRVRGNGCPYCSGKYVLKGFNDLATLYSDVAKQWDYELNNDMTPSDVLGTSNTVVYWKCDKGHSWKTKISTRTRMNAGCPVCCGLIPEKGVNDLATLFPEVAKQWDYEKNGELKPTDIVPGSEKMIWWICDKGHSYPAIPRTRTYMGTGCPVCQNKRVVAGLNDLSTLHPELATEWNYEKNGDLLPTQVGGNGGSHKKVWWICDKGHEWEATLASRISLHTGCPKCAIERTRKK